VNCVGLKRVIFSSLCVLFVSVLVPSQSPMRVVGLLGGLSDGGYNSLSSEDARRIVANISRTDATDVAPATERCHDDVTDTQGIIVYQQHGRASVFYRNRLG